MKYVFLVSHGTFAPGLAHALSMLAGSDREDILSAGLTEDMGADVFAEEVREKLKGITPEDEIILLGDIVGGSPLTTASNVIAEESLLPNTTIVGGVNLPFAITVTLMKDVMDTDSLIEQQIGEAKEELKRFEVETDSDEDEI